MAYFIIQYGVECIHPSIYSALLIWGQTLGLPSQMKCAISDKARKPTWEVI